MDHETEARLLEGLRQGNESAFDEIYAAYRPRIFSFVVRMVGRREVAEELCQEVWLRVAARAATLREDTRLAPWLFTVARNLCASYWRTRRFESVGGTVVESFENVPETSASPELRAENEQMVERLGRALARLPAAYREALLLLGIEELSPAEAAAVCGVRPEAMRKRIERARDMAAALMEPHHPRARRL